jgi:hypothetical protein
MIKRDQVNHRHNTYLCKKEEKLKQMLIASAKHDFGDKLHALKNDQQYIIDICTFVENRAGSIKVNKKQLILDALHEIFNLDSEDLLRVSNLIDVIYQNNWIKKDKFRVVVYRYVKSFVINFFLIRQ